MTRTAHNNPKITATNQIASGRLHLGDGRYVYRRISAAIERHAATGLRIELDIEVDRAGNPHCRTLTLSNPEAQTFDSITTEAVRKIPVSTLIHQCFLEAQYELVETDSEDKEPVFEVRGIDRRKLYSMYPKGARRSKQRKPITDDELRGVAKLYRLAAENNYAPTKLIADQHHVNRATARRWVKRAEERGFIDADQRLDQSDGGRRRGG